MFQKKCVTLAHKRFANFKQNWYQNFNPNTNVPSSQKRHVIWSLTHQNQLTKISEPNGVSMIPQPLLTKHMTKKMPLHSLSDEKEESFLNHRNLQVLNPNKQLSLFLQNQPQFSDPNQTTLYQFSDHHLQFKANNLSWFVIYSSASYLFIKHTSIY